MTPKEAIEKIKALFTETPAPVAAPVVAPVELEAKEYSLADGTKVKIDKVEAGGKVTILDATGAETPAPAGVHTLADGTAVTVAEGGAITEVKAAEPAVPELMNTEILTQMAAFKQANDKEVEHLKDELKTIKQGFNELVSLVESLIETPAAEPIEPQKSQFGERAQTKKDMYKNILEAVDRAKKN